MPIKVRVGPFLLLLLLLAFHLSSCLPQSHLQERNQGSKEVGSAQCNDSADNFEKLMLIFPVPRHSSLYWQYCPWTTLAMRRIVRKKITFLFTFYFSFLWHLYSSFFNVQSTDHWRVFSEDDSFIIQTTEQPRANCYCQTQDTRLHPRINMTAVWWRRYKCPWFIAHLKIRFLSLFQNDIFLQNLTWIW